MRRRVVRLILRGILVILFVAVGLGGWGYYEFTRPGPLDAPARVIVAKGSGVTTIARQLEDSGIVSSAFVFSAAVELTGHADRLQAGEFEFPAGASMRQAALIIVSGRTVKRRVTVPEGLTVAQIIALLEGTEGLMGRIDPLPEEGELLPETYFFSYGDDKNALVARMRTAMEEAIEDLWSLRRPALPISSRREAITLASIIERETAVATERPLVSSVFYNRLGRGMRLQSDPTVAYALQRLGAATDRPLTRDDLKVDSPYNTYRIKGLPPGPIANPGIESLRAALVPADTEFLYFVADGNGGHVFAQTHDEHVRNVAAWRRLRREREAETNADAK